MSVEIIITAAIIAIAVYILFKDLRKRAAGKCPSCTQKPGEAPCCQHCSDREGLERKTSH